MQGTDSGVDTYFGFCTYPGRELRHRVDLKVIEAIPSYIRKPSKDYVEVQKITLKFTESCLSSM